MKLPIEVIETRTRYLVAFPLWSMPPGPDAEERARRWTYGLAEQIGYDYPALRFGSKRADQTRPLSKDTLAQHPEKNAGRLYSWDQLSGAGTGTPTLVVSPDGEDITGQVFVPVKPTDHLSGAPTTPTPEPPSSVIPYNEAYAVEFGKACNDVYRESGKPFDPGMVSVHSSRAAWDYYVGGLPWPDSFKKHINEFRVEYGLAPLP